MDQDNQLNSIGSLPVIRLTLFMLGIVAFMGGLALAKGGVFVGQHEGDMMHLMAITQRMAAGQMPHFDFMTPIGALAFVPITEMLKAGFGIGHALIWSQIIVAITLVPAVLWVTVSRLKGAVAFGFCALCMIMVLALVHGESQPTVSFSMHYNRWAWALSFIVIALSALPPLKMSRPLIDGLVIGAVMAALAMIKVTYFVALLPAVVVALLQLRQYRTLALSLAVGLVIALILTLFLGLEYWVYYVLDMLATSQSALRVAPGLALSEIMASPAYVHFSILLLCAVVVLRAGGEKQAGLIMLLLTPAFWYITYQNFGNDPQWLPMLAVLLLAWRPSGPAKTLFGLDMRQALNTMAIVALVAAAPSLLNLAYSPLRHFNTDVSEYTEVLPNQPDFQSPTIRMMQLDARVPYDTPDHGMPAYVERKGASSWQGEALPICALELGMKAWFVAVAEDLEARGFAGSKIFIADVFSTLWLFGDFEPLKNGAPWYYGGLPGFEDADYLLIPLCPGVLSVRAEVLAAVEDSGIEMRNVLETPAYILAERITN